MADLVRAIPPILLVEDDPLQANLLRQVIGRAGIANPVTLLSDGLAAEAYLTGTDSPRPVLMLLDLGLPGAPGLQVLETARRLFDSDALPIIVLSGSGEAASVDRAFELGANSYLVKPVAFTALVDTLERLTLVRAFFPKDANLP